MKTKNNIIITLLIIFIISFIARISIYNLQNYPLQASSLDGTFHIASAEDFMQNYDIMKPYLAQGNKNIVDANPPIFYLLSDILSKTGIHIWNSVYIITAFFSAIIVCLVFILTLLIFKNKQIALIAASISIIPIPASTWLSNFQNGQFPVVLGHALLFLILILLYSYTKNPTITTLTALSVTTAILVLAHFPELIIFAPFIAIALLYTHLKQKKIKIKQMLKHGIIFLIPPILALLYYSPKIFNIWMKIKPSQFYLIPKALDCFPYTLSLIKFLSLSKINIFFLLLALVGIIIAIYKKKIFFIILWLYFAIMIYLTPYFVSEPEYFIKLRYLFPYLVAIPAALTIFTLLKNLKLKKPLILIISLLLILVSIPSIIEFKQNTYTVMTPEKFEALQWIEQNTPANSKIIFINGFYEWTGVFAKRHSFEVDVNWLRKNKQNTTTFKGTWIGHSQNLPVKESFFKYKQLRDVKNRYYLEDNVKVEDFDIIISENREFSEFNNILNDFELIYNKNLIQIRKI